MNVVTRFAPSPSGLLHLGHAYSALRAWDFARQARGRFLLRIEDIDFNRCRPEFEARLKEDLAWLGIRWEEPVRRQSDHPGDFLVSTGRLEAMGVIYPCFCTRKEILAEIARAGSAPHGFEGPVYPGLCRGLSPDEKAVKMASRQGFALRIDLEKALALTGRELEWTDLEHGRVVTTEADWRSIGDVVLARKDIQTSYHVAVVTDDAGQGVTHVIRGLDLFPSTHLHILLQTLLGLPHPVYLHHQLVRDESGKRLAKRDEAETLASLREKGVTPGEIRTRLGLTPAD